MILKYEFRRTNLICPEERFAGPLGGQRIEFREPKRIIDFSDIELIALIDEYPHLAKRYFEWFEVHLEEEPATNAKGKKRKKKVNEQSETTGNTADSEEAETPQEQSDLS